jgi:hypothetical protein
MDVKDTPADALTMGRGRGSEAWLARNGGIMNRNVGVVVCPEEAGQGRRRARRVPGWGHVARGLGERGRKRVSVVASSGWCNHGSGQRYAEKLLGAGDAGGMVARASSRLRARERGMAAAG